MHEKIANSKLKIIQQAGHLSNLENPIAFNTHLVKFLELVGKKSSLVKKAVLNQADSPEFN
jgi:hypothetical protein